MASRVFAFVAAVAMVLGAVAVRGRIDDHRDAVERSGPLQLVCATELREVCDAIDGTGSGFEVTVEPAAVTAARLRSADPDDAALDGWLAPGPWSEIVDVSRPPSAGKLFAAATAPLARSPFVLAVWKDKRARLTCSDAVNLGCVGDAVISRGFRLGASADDEASGVLTDAALAVGHINNPNFATNDLDETDLAQWVAAVDTSVDRVGRNPGGRSFTELLTFGAAAADGYLSTEAEIGPAFAGAAKRGQLDVAYVQPVATVDVQFAPRPGDRGNRLAAIVNTDRVRELLRSKGWRVAGQPGIPGVNPTAPKLADDDGLPSAGVLDALLEITH